MTHIRTRFAPSPTGRLHVGNIRTALHNWLLAKQGEGKFLLRIDNTDAERSKDEYIAAIEDDLGWLGLDPDSQVRQSERTQLYDDAFALLRGDGRVYPCYETAQELELKRKIQLGQGKPPIYDRGALALTDEERAAKEREGIKPHWRFKLDHDEPIRWDDAIRGPQNFDPAQLSDPVIRRGDGSWLYMLPSTADDVEMGITDVLRGEDHVSNTAVQIQMFTALGAKPPRFAHEALLVGTEGKLSKRLGSRNCDDYRADGIEAEALIDILARIGTSLPVEPIADRVQIIETFDLSTFSRAPARFDEAELARLNAQIVHKLPYPAVAARLPEGMDEAAWEAIRPNLETVAGAADYWRIITGPLEVPPFDAETRDFLAQAAEIANDIAWGDSPWKALTSKLKSETGRTGKALFLPLRQAITGQNHGPDMNELLPLIGKEKTHSRLARAASGES